MFLGEEIKQKTICMQVFKRAYKKYHRQHSTIIETSKEFRK